MFILLASQNLNDLITFNVGSISSDNEYRIWLLICIVFVLPLSWFGTPKNFWPVAIFAILATIVGCLLIIAKIGYDFESGAPKRKVTSGSFFSGNDVKKITSTIGYLQYVSKPFNHFLSLSVKMNTSIWK